MAHGAIGRGAGAKRLVAILANEDAEGLLPMVQGHVAPEAEPPRWGVLGASAVAVLYRDSAMLGVATRAESRRYGASALGGLGGSVGGGAAPVGTEPASRALGVVDGGLTPFAIEKAEHT